MMTDRIQKLRELFFAGAHKHYRVEDLGLSILTEETRKLPFAIRKAMAFACALRNMNLFLLDGDLICGGKAVYKLPEYITDDELAWGNHNLECGDYYNLFDFCFNEGQDDRGFGVVNSSIPAFYRIIPAGLPAYIDDAKKRLTEATEEEKIIYYRSVVIVQTAALELMKRYEALCRQQAAAADGTRKAELETMAGNLAQLQIGPPQSYWQAVQLYYFLQFLIWVEQGFLVPLGRTDQILEPFLQKDIAAGILTKEFALEILEAFFLKLNYEVDKTHGEPPINSDSGQSITIGGCDPISGEPAYNEMTMLILDAKCETGVTDPKIHLRVNSQTPEAIWKKAAYLNSLGGGFPTYENDDAIIPAIMSHPEYTLEHARDYAASGCWEITIQGRSLNRNYGGVCCLRMLEMALNDGQFALGIPSANAVGLIDDRYGIKTGRLEWFDTYAKLFNAFKVQMKHHIDMVTSYANRSLLSPSPFYSSLMEGTLENGKDLCDYGSIYNETDFQLASLSNAADALYAIRRLVYQEKRFTLRQFNDILLANWQGHEELRQEILNDFPKFGNNDGIVDSIANDILQCFVREVTKHRNASGQTYRARISSATAYVMGAQILGASADGRKARDYYSDNLSPMMGAAQNGPTAIVLSCGNLNVTHCAGGSVLDMKFHPSALNSEEGRDKFIAMLKTYCKVGGMQTQINVLDNKVLLDAQAHPENYRDLMVRIWGFSAYFTAIDKCWQDHIIARSTLSF